MKTFYYSGFRKLDNGLRCAKLTPTPIPIEIPS